MAPLEPAESTLSMSRSYSEPLDAFHRPVIDPRADISNLDDDVLSIATSTQSSAARAHSVGSGRKKTLASVYRAQNKAPDLWKTSAVSEYVSDRHSIAALKDLCGSDEGIYINGDALKHVKNLGEGAYAEVSIAEYRGQDGTLPPRQVAVKQLKSQVMTSASDVVDFVEEVRVLHRLSAHRNIVDFVGFGCLDTSSCEAEWRTLFLVQEYMHGGTLKSKILNQMVKRPQIVYTHVQGLRWCLNIAEGIAAMHASVPMVIHRDLKSDNVLLTNHGTDAVAKIADLGLHAMVTAQGVEDPNAPFTDVDSAESECDTLSVDRPSFDSPFKPAKSYTVVGSEAINPLRSGQAAAEDVVLWKMTGKTGAFCYMAPEVLLGEPYNEKVDVFSLGVIIFEVFSQRLIGADYLNSVGWDESEAHAHKVAAGYRPPFPLFMHDEIRQLIDVCWSGTPALRPSMAEVVCRLRALQEMGIVEEMDAVQAKSSGCGCSLM
ncbi:hypothetical protein Ndes2526B_g03542 [Nannochloris sp. 'desiccata']|nr:putative Dual specificity protein kinase splA [Chlorella desiccata (nom. nud.)]